MSDKKPRFTLREPDCDIFHMEQAGLQNVDKIIASFCVSILFACITLLASSTKMPGEAPFFALVTIIADIPASLAFLWHMFRWPIRLEQRQKALERANKDICKQLEKYWEEFGIPRVHEEISEKCRGLIFHELEFDQNNRISSEKVKEVIDKKLEETVKREIINAGEKFLNSNPFITNLMSQAALAVKKQSLSGKLPESYARLKQVIDIIARATRYPLLLIVVFSLLMCVIEVVKYKL